MAGEASGGQDGMHLAIKVDRGATDPRQQDCCGAHLKKDVGFRTSDFGCVCCTVSGQTRNLTSAIRDACTHPLRTRSEIRNPKSEIVFHLLSCNSATGPSTSTIRTVSFLRLSMVASVSSKRVAIMRSIDWRPMILSRIIKLSLYFCPSCG